MFPLQGVDRAISAEARPVAGVIAEVHRSSVAYLVRVWQAE